MAMPQDFAVFQSQLGENAVVFDPEETLILLVGDVDLAVADDLDIVGKDATDRGLPIRADLSRVTFMDSTGVTLLARLVRCEAEHHRRVVVTGPPLAIRELLAITGLTRLVDVAEPRPG
jgi:anti-sigma B factor antagonist